MDATTSAVIDESVLDPVKQALENSWVRPVGGLNPETPENLARSRQFESLPPDDANQRKRPVFNGHYVLVQPRGLRQPRLLLYSPTVAKDLLHLTDEQIDSPAFVQWVSGNLVLGETWATPYGLSIMGKLQSHNCPYGTGNGYGDGRAISIGELHGQELQLKGAGTTPFHRGADGRAVLRSSIREFLASEAMHFLGIPTTRALSLVVSPLDTSQRPWYTDDAVLQLPTMDDPRLQRFPEEQRRQILRQLRFEKADPNIMIREKNAITCRVASSFMRIGHIDLFSRRAKQKSMETSASSDATLLQYDTGSMEWKESEAIIWHACYREFREDAYQPFRESNDIAAAAHVLLEKSAEAIASMVAGWVRVGFAQGNFNGDNCLVGGKTMDYGPFGWMEEYFPLFAKWTGSGQHFGFMNQPSAGLANYQVLVSSVVPVICANNKNYTSADEDRLIKEYVEKASVVFQRCVDETFRIKLGFTADQDVADEIFEELEGLLRKSRVDWTIFFRQLSYVVRDFPLSSSAGEEKNEEGDYASMFQALEGDEEARTGSSPFYESLSSELRLEWISWMEKWRKALVQSTMKDGTSSVDSDAVYERMRLANPKYVLREWMLVKAYTDADNDQDAELYYLFNLIQRPYDEGSEHEAKQYYRRTPDELQTAGGTAFMS